MTTVAVVFGGLSMEHDVSILTGLQASRLLGGAGFETVEIYWSKSGDWFRVPSGLEGPAFSNGAPEGSSEIDLEVPGGFVERRRLRSSQLDVDAVVNCCHGGPGEEGALHSMLLLCGIPVTGPAPLPSAWAMDKLSSAGIPELCGTASHGVTAIQTLSQDDDLSALPTPWVVKPRFGGSSLDIEVSVDDPETVRALSRSGTRRGGVVVQPYLEGWTDLNIAYRRHPKPEVSAIERPLKTKEIYSYAEKYLAGADGMSAAVRELPADLPDEIAERIRGAAMQMADGIGLTGLPRIDFLWDGADQLVFCEINAIPGSLGLYLWSETSEGRAAVLADLVREALDAPAMAHWTAATDGRALKAAGSIAAKLG